MHKLTNDFLRAIIQNVPDVPDNAMQWWAGHSPELQKVLLPLLTIPMPTVVGTYDTNLGSVGQIGVDLQGNCWLPFYRTTKVGKMTPGGVMTLIDLGAGALPGAVDVAPDGSIWVSAGAGEIFRLDPNTGAVLWRSVVGKQGSGLRVDQATGDVWYLDRANCKAYRITQNQNVQSYPTGGCPWAITFAKTGTVWISNGDDCTLTKITPANKASGQSETIVLSGHRYAGSSVAADALGNVCGGEIGGVTRIDVAGKKQWYPFPANCPSYPDGGVWPDVAVDSKNNVWVAQGGTGNLVKIDSNGVLGSPIDIGGAGTDAQYSLCVDSDDYVWISYWDGANKRGVGRVSPAGVFEGPFVSGLCRRIGLRGNRVWIVNEESESNNTVVQLTR